MKVLTVTIALHQTKVSTCSKAEGSNPGSANSSRVIRKLSILGTMGLELPPYIKENKFMKPIFKK